MKTFPENLRGGGGLTKGLRNKKKEKESRSGRRTDKLPFWGENSAKEKRKNELLGEVSTKEGSGIRVRLSPGGRGNSKGGGPQKNAGGNRKKGGGSAAYGLGHR